MKFIAVMGPTLFTVRLIRLFGEETQEKHRHGDNAVSHLSRNFQSKRSGQNGDSSYDSSNGGSRITHNFLLSCYGVTGCHTTGSDSTIKMGGNVTPRVSRTDGEGMLSPVTRP